MKYLPYFVQQVTVGVGEALRDYVTDSTHIHVQLSVVDPLVTYLPSRRFGEPLSLLHVEFLMNRAINSALQE